MIVQTKPCMVCGVVGHVDVPSLEALEAWQEGALIQRAMPELSADEREQLMTGTHPECWDRMTGGPA